jgi:hypothetical protein
MVAKKDLERAKKSRAIRKAASASLRSVTPQIIMTAVVCVLGIAGLMVLTVYYGINLGIKSIEKEADVSILRTSDEYEVVKYESQEISYVANSNCINGVGDSDCLLDIYGSKDTNYINIKSGDQYRRFVDIARNSVGAEINLNITDDFFRTGNVVAIVKEDKSTASYSLKTVERNEDYGLRIKVQKSELPNNVEATDTGHLILVKIPNIQTTDIEIIEQE